MPTIVNDNLRNRKYVLIGTGFGASKTARPNPLYPSTITTNSESELVAVADQNGQISWLPSMQLTVVSVDGFSCRQLLSQTD